MRRLPLYLMLDQKPVEVFFTERIYNSQAGMRVTSPWDREPTGMSAPERAMDGLEACPKGKLPVARRSAGTGLSGFDWGFVGSWVVLLKHATSTSMWPLGRRRPVGSRFQEDYPTPDELCEFARSGFD